MGGTPSTLSEAQDFFPRAHWMGALIARAEALRELVPDEFRFKTKAWDFKFGLTDDQIMSPWVAILFALPGASA